MGTYPVTIDYKPPRKRRALWTILALLLLILLTGRSFARLAIEYQWWKELGQLNTWFNLILYGTVPVILAGLLTFLFLWFTHYSGVRFARVSVRYYPTYRRIILALLLLVSFLIAGATIDNWTVIRFVGGKQLPADAMSWTDPLFQRPLAFYLFDLPFYVMLRQFLLVLVIGGAVVFWITARGWQLKQQWPRWAEAEDLDFRLFQLEGALESRFLRLMATTFHPELTEDPRVHRYFARLAGAEEAARVG